jgi:hypothetical protein
VRKYPICMNICRTRFTPKITPAQFQTRFAFPALLLGSLMLITASATGAQYYTNWVDAHSLGAAQRDPLADPDGDGEPNVVEFAFGTDPLAGGGIAGAVQPVFGGISGTNAVFQVEILEREGHQPGVQIDLYLSKNLTNWFRPWWLRTTTNSLAGDPVGSVRENFTTRLPGTNIWFVRPKVQLFDGGAEAAKYYMATNGNDGNTGTSNSPFATLIKVAGMATNGNLVYIRGGTYAAAAKASFTNNGSAATPIRIRAYPGESPVINGSSFADDVISISGSCYQFYGLTFTNAGHNSIRISGNSNTIERCVSLGARNTGFHISGGDGAAIYPACNLFLNCDSIRSYDGPQGDDADGFSAKWSLGTNNVFSGCRAWENSDDNWDLWEGIAPILITNCWAFRAATNVFWDAATNTAFAGNGQGFKIGGAGTAAVHRVVGCLAFANKSWGIDQNNNRAGQIVDQNTCWNNGSGAINLNHVLPKYGTLLSSHILRNNVALGTADISDTPYVSIQASNTWQVLTTVNTNDFLSIDYNAWAKAPRRDDGGLPDTPFLRPVPTGRLVDKGTNIGGPFIGSRPDLGAYETSTW